MKDINLIKTIPIHRQYEINRWFLFSIILLVSIIGTVTFLEVPQLHELHTVKTEKNKFEGSLHMFESIMEQKHNLRQTKQNLKQQLSKIEQCKRQPKSPVKQLTVITQACTQTVQLDKVAIHNRSVTISAACSHTKDTMRFMQNLSQPKQAQNLSLVSMQKQNNQGLHFTLQGTM